MSVLLQISDTHFGTEQPPVVAALLMLIEAVEPRVIVLSGDVTQRARRAQFNAARQFLDQLGDTPLLALPGNHDIPLFNVAARLLYPYAGYQRAFGQDLEPQFASDAFLVLGVNTTRWYRHVDGEISDRQIQRVADQLAADSSGRVRIVVVHQPVHVTRRKDEKNVVHGHAAAVRAWAQAGADIVMGGHIHLPYVRPLAERFDDLPRRIWCVQAGTAISHRVRYSAPNSVNIVRMNPGALECCVERWDYDSQQSRFAQAENTELALQR